MGRQEGEGHEGHEAPRHEEEEGRGCGGGADEGHAEEVSLSWAHTSNGARFCREAPRIGSSTVTCGASRTSSEALAPLSSALWSGERQGVGGPFAGFRCVGRPAFP